MREANTKNAGKLNRREERTRKEQQEKRKVRIVAVIVVIVFALLVAGALLINSKFIRRAATAISIGGINFTPAEFDFFYNSTYREYSDYINNYYGDYASTMLPETNRAHASQLFNPDTGETWADYFASNAITQMSELVQYYNASKSAGYVLPDDKIAEIDNEISVYRQYAADWGYPSLDAFIQQTIAMNMNEKSLRNLLEFVTTASAYSEYVTDSLVYSEEELADYYSENRNNLDSFTYRYFLILSDAVTESDYDTTEAYEAAKEESLQASYARAAQIAGEINSEDDLIAAAREYNENTYKDPDSTLKVYPGSWLGTTYGEWLQDDARQPGDVSSFEIATGGYVVYFIDRDPNEYNMVQMRQIFIARQVLDTTEFDGGDEDPAYKEAFNLVDMVAAGRAEEVLNLFIEGGATEDKLIELMADYSDDSTEGGFYGEITKNQANNKKPQEIEQWLFTPGRQVGDYEVIYSEADGYYLVYFSGFGERYCDFLADSGLREKDYSEWHDSLEPVEAVKKWAFILTAN